MYTGLTKAGEIYLANRLANKLPVNFLKVKIGNGTVPHGADASETTELYSFKKEIQILDITQTDNVARIRVLIDNSDVEQGFFMKELGVYVDDNGKEKLYWYVYEDNGQYVHSKTERAIQFDLELVMEVTSSNSTILDWNKDKVWISKNYFDEKVRTFEIPTIAELQSRKNLKVGDIVEVLGYYTAGDGAGHKRIIANEDDGSGVQLKNGLYANILHNGEVNVSWFGAKGDGVTDDSDSIIKAFNFAMAQDLEINFNKKKYYFSKKIKLKKKGINFNGATLVITQKSLDSGQITFYNDENDVTDIVLTKEDINNKDFSKLTKYKKCKVLVESNDEVVKREHPTVPITVYKTDYMLVSDGKASFQTYSDYKNITRISIKKIEDNHITIKDVNLEIEMFNDNTAEYTNSVFAISNIDNVTLKNINIVLKNNNRANNPQRILDIGNCYNLTFDNVNSEIPYRSREGSYIFLGGKIIDLKMYNCHIIKTNDTQWAGIGTNIIKQWSIYNSEIDRMDAHTFGGGNYSIIDSKVDNISVMGDMDIICERSKIGMIGFRYDYNNLFTGNIFIRDCIPLDNSLISFYHRNFYGNESLFKCKKIYIDNIKIPQSQERFIIYNISKGKNFS